MDSSSTLCWRCANACGACTWSHSYEPVEGWLAVRTRLESNRTRGAQDSYHVISCPKYLEERRGR